MADKKKRDQAIAQIIRILYDAGASKWSIQDKGTLMAAVKLQLQEVDRR